MALSTQCFAKAYGRSEQKKIDCAAAWRVVSIRATDNEVAAAMLNKIRAYDSPRNMVAHRHRRNSIIIVRETAVASRPERRAYPELSKARNHMSGRRLSAHVGISAIIAWRRSAFIYGESCECPREAFYISAQGGSDVIFALINMYNLGGGDMKMLSCSSLTRAAR